MAHSAFEWRNTRGEDTSVFLQLTNMRVKAEGHIHTEGCGAQFVLCHTQTHIHKGLGATPTLRIRIWTLINLLRIEFLTPTYEPRSK